MDPKQKQFCSNPKLSSRYSGDCTRILYPESTAFRCIGPWTRLGLFAALRVNVFPPGYGLAPVHRIYMDSHCHYKFTAESAEQNLKTEDRGQKTAIRRPFSVLRCAAPASAGASLSPRRRGFSAVRSWTSSKKKVSANQCRFTAGLDRICCPQYTCTPTIWQMLDA